MKNGKLTPLSGEKFDAAVLETKRTVLVLFGGETCTPCHALEPVLAELALLYLAQVDFFILDAETEADLAANFQVRGLPTVLLFTAGKLRSRIVGQKAAKQYKIAIETCLAAP